MYTLQDVFLFSIMAFLFGVLMAAVVYLLGTLRRPEQPRGITLPLVRHRTGLGGR